jgi:AcrR family transcriptional regulator
VITNLPPMPRPAGAPTVSSAPASRPLPGPRLSADERRADIVEAAIKAFAAGGLHGTSTEDVARLAGVSQPYLFRLFGTKKELFLAAVDRSFARIEAMFEDAARHPVPGTDSPYGPILASIAQRYGGLLKDQSLLRMQLHAFAASDDPEIREAVRQRFSGVISLVSARSGVPVSELREFFAMGMLMNVAAAMQLDDSELAWDLMCEGVPDQPA